MRHHPTRGSSPDPGCWDRFVSSESAAGPGVPWRLGIGRPGPAGRLSPQQGGKFSVTLPNSSEGQLRETPRAGGPGEKEDVDHQLSPPGEGQCAGRGSRPRCIFFFLLGGNLVALSVIPVSGTSVFLNTSHGGRKQWPPLLLSLVPNWKGRDGVGGSIKTSKWSRSSSPKPARQSRSLSAPC